MERLREILYELINKLEIKDVVKVVVAPMKHKIASLSLKTKTLRISKKAVEVLSDEELKYVLAHELIHLKIRDVNHGHLFIEELKKLYDFKDVNELEVEIIANIMDKTSDNNI